MAEVGPVEAQLAGSPALRAGSVDHGGWWDLNTGGVLNIYGHLTEDECQRIGCHSRIVQVQFGRHFPVRTAMWRALDEHVFRSHPGALLWYGWVIPDTAVDLRCLEHLPSLRGLTVWGNRPDLSPVRDHGGIVELRVVDGDVRPVAGVGSIRSLWLGKGARHREVAGELPNLEDLTISGVTVTDLSHLESLQRLTSLAIWFGATRRFSELLRLRHVCRVDIWRVRQLEMTDLEPLNTVAGLETLALRELPRVTSLSWLTNPSVRNLELDLKNLASLTCLTGLPGLENLALRRPVPDDASAQLSELPGLRAVYGLRDPKPEESARFERRPMHFIGGEFMHRPPLLEVD